MLKNTVLKSSTIIRSLALLTVMLACQDEKIIENDRGDIVGFVNLLDANGLKIQNAADVKVSLDEEHSVMTNSSGRYEFKNVKAGTYHPVFEKEGFGTMKRFNFLFAAGNVPGVLDLTNIIKLPSTKLLTKNVEVNGSQLLVTGTLEQTDSYYLLFSFYDKADGKPGDEIAASYSSSCCAPTQDFQSYLYMPQNATLYLAIYAVSPGNQNSQYSYYDYERSVWVNTALKELVAPFKVR